ncbi:hypothetical protein ACQV2B_23050 [Pantoea allii]|uniref:hypothetical protein n=1 Tax=Pantoea allii TaxID=574096 RepID=UPI003D313A8B
MMKKTSVGLICCLVAVSVRAAISGIPEIVPVTPTAVTGGPTVFTQSAFNSLLNAGAAGANTYLIVNPDGLNSVGVLLGAEAAYPNINMMGLNGFVLRGSTDASTTGRYSIFSDTDPAQNITGYNQFLFLAEPGAFIARWETTGGGTVSGT